MNDNTHSPHRPLTTRDAALGIALASLAVGILVALIALFGTPAAGAAGGGGVSTGDGGGDGSVSGGKAVFPFRGPHTYGDGFGAGRNHQGQDIFANCGTRMVAAEAGRIQTRGTHSAAGNYLVIDLKGSKVDQVYMHLKRPSRLDKGDRVGAGRLIGKVGETGNASGCHLHFEMWKPGYYESSDSRALRRVTKYLRALDRQS